MRKTSKKKASGYLLFIVGTDGDATMVAKRKTLVDAKRLRRSIRKSISYGLGLDVGYRIKKAA